MGTSMINLNAGFDPYKDYTNILKKSAHIKVEDEAVKKADDQITVAANVESASSYAVESLKREVPSAEVTVISESLKGIQDFQFAGKFSDIKKLDTGSAVSDLQKDDILQEYQYFVGSSKEIGIDAADGLVLIK